MNDLDYHVVDPLTLVCWRCGETTKEILIKDRQSLRRMCIPAEIRNARLVQVNLTPPRNVGCCSYCGSPTEEADCPRCGAPMH